jgi:predicted phage baseplate assembly protein
MALPAPILDDRKYQDIVSEARSLIPGYCPEWTDHNLSDPGITFIELFAWMMDTLLYRVNKVPEKSYIRFLELIGIHLTPAKPAKADITFRLSAPQSKNVTIPKGTEVATVRTETQDALTFSTERDMIITVPKMAASFISRGGTVFHDYMPVLKMRELMDIFQKVPQEHDAFYLGYGENIAGNTMRLVFETSIEGIGVDPRNPPLAWEYWDGDENKWAGIRMESDSTGGLNRDGEIILHIPYSCSSNQVNEKEAFWIRCRVVKSKPRQPAYSASPKVQSVTTNSIGGTVPAYHCFIINNEVLGRSTGEPGQSFYLQSAPILPRDKGEIIEVEGKDGKWEKWEEIMDFASLGADDHSYMLDSATGEVLFGPRIRQPNGEVRQFGAIPAKGSRIRFSKYRCGGGVNGNVGQKTLSVLKSSIPYVSWVTNLESASGGTDSETLDHAKLRAPRILKTRVRAITADDYEYLASEASEDVSRAKCLVPGSLEEKGGVAPGTVQVLLVPAVRAKVEQITREDLVIPERIRKLVTEYLDERRLITTQVKVSSPEYIWVSVEARIKAKVKADQRRIKSEIESKLNEFINPVYGGYDGNGWEFGRDLLASDIYGPLQDITGVQYVDSIKLYHIDIETGKKDQATDKISITSNQLPCSYQHRVVIS